MKVKANLNEIIYNKIVESLIRGEYSVGQKILLNDLCEKFEVSRTPVVQAVKMLNKDGILTIMKNGRACVPEYEYDTVKQICEVRKLVEGYALEALLAEKDEEVFAVKFQCLKQYAEECARCCEREDYVGLAMRDLNFHEAIVACSGNEILEDLYTGVQGRFIVVNYLSRPLKERNYRGTVADHFELLDFIKKREKANALKKLYEHINGIIVILKEREQAKGRS